MINISSLRNALVATALSCAIFSPSHADDTEIFFGQSADAFETNPNIIFVLDVSGSMGETDGTKVTRLNRMKSAMRLLLDQSSNFNVGVMSFLGASSGASVLYPIADLDSDTSELCPDGICPNETVFVRPFDGSDDAVQNNNNLTVSLNDEFLIMGNVDSNTVDQANGTGTSNDTFNDTDSVNLVTRTYNVSISTQENADLNTDFLNHWRRNASANPWFFENDTLDDSLFGYRFGNIAIPRNARVTNAFITFTQVGGASQVGEVSAFISAEQTATATAFPNTGSSDNEDIHTLSDRLNENNRTNAIVSWDQIPGTVDNPPETAGKLVTPDLEGIVNEIINLPDWKTGNAMSFIVSPLDNYLGSAENVRTVHGRNTISGSRPKLTITYEELEGDNLPVQTTLVQSTSHVDEFIHQNDNTVWRNTTNEVSTLFHVGAGNFPRQLALRFPNVNVPAGAIIESAFLKLGVRSNEIGSPASDWQLTQGNSVEPNGASDGIDSKKSDFDVTLNIHTELSADPLADTDTPISDPLRQRTQDFVSWVTRETDATNNTLTSPSLSSVVQETISLPEWENAKTLSLIIAPSGDYPDDTETLLRILTTNSNARPELEITFSVPEEADANNRADYTTALRFRNVHVPPGATIESARLIMHAAAVNGDAANLTIFAEKTPNSEAFSDVNNDIGKRDPTDASVLWNPDPWVAVGNEYSSIPISNVISEITDLSDWCGGNALTIMIDGSSATGINAGNRFAQSFENDPVLAPSLEIVYAPDTVPTDGYCSNTSVIFPAAQGTDDAVQNLNSGNMSLNDTYLSTARSESGTGNNAIGLRFDGLQLPQGAVITNAAIEFVAATELPDAFSMRIAMQQSIDAQPYSSTNNQDKIGGRQYTNSVSWDHPGNIVSGDNLFTSNLTELLKSAIDEPNWQPGNAVAFKIEANSGVLDVISNDGEESSAPRLIVYYQTLRTDPGSQHRQQVQQAVDSLLAQGGTPIVSSLYEAANYMNGREVDFGRTRGLKTRHQPNFRVSHPESYEGGSVIRNRFCRDSNLSSIRCSNERIDHTPTPAVYKSPISSQCQSNHIVLLSDGTANSSPPRDRIQSLVGQNCATTSNSSETCGVELASWLNNTDQTANFAGDQLIQTHTIGFNLDDPQFLIDIARAGGGQFRSANSAAELLGAFKSIINNVSNRNASFVAPGATVSQFNRLRNSNDIYYAMFKPSGTARWQGNLKRYEIDVAANENTGIEEFGLFDVNGNLAVDSATGTFAPNARSFWSDVTDGDTVELGGASEQQKNLVDYTTRNVVTYSSAHTNRNLRVAVNRFDSRNPHLNREAFNLPPLIANDPAAVDKIINWGKGADVDDQNVDGNVTQLRQFIGDPLHASPIVTNYSDGESVIYMATNEGFLHALDTDTGEEHFAFIPEELFSNIYRLYRNEATTNRPYGLDGGLTLWHDDTDQDGLIDRTETAILYIAMRRGGNAYYALDISNYKAPVYRWSIQGGEISADDGNSVTAEGDYRELSSTWSLPVKTKIIDRSEVKDVIIFAGGYDQNQDPIGDLIIDGQVIATDDVRKPDSIGRAIFIADAKTGELIWQTSQTSGFSDMLYSIPSRVRNVDVNFDGIIDQLYVGDTGGQLWRMDFDNSLVSTQSIDQRISAGVIADVSGDTPQSNRKFYYPPDIAVINLGGEQQLSISIGTGWRAHPLDDIVDDRLYSFRTPHVFGRPVNSLGGHEYTTITEDSNRLIDVTDDIDTVVEPEDVGWFIRFDNEGEKVLSSSLTFNNQLIFTSYVPSNSGFSCDAAIGSGSVYALNIFNGAPILNLDNIGEDDDLTRSDRSRVLSNPGLPPEVSVLFPDTDTGSSQDGEPLFQVGKETITELESGKVSQTTFWQEVTENHDE